jgi:hypothetical protein
MGEGCESARNAQVVDSGRRGDRDRRQSHHLWRTPRPAAGEGYVEEAYVRLIPSLFMRCLRVPGFNRSRTAAPSLPSITQ